MSNPYLDHYRQQAEHQREHSRIGLLDGRPQEFCIECVLNGQSADTGRRETKLYFAWAVPSEAALEAIAEHSPNGVVEIGAGAGYWAAMLRERGVDVIAYDPAPPGHESEWHSGQAWSEVELGDHQAVSKHPDRTLLLVWPSYSQSWTDEVVELYEGDTIVYVGEGPHGCTGTDRMHQLLGHADMCWCIGECECPPAPEPLFAEHADVVIPRWSGLNDRMSIYKRR